MSYTIVHDATQLVIGPASVDHVGSGSMSLTSQTDAAVVIDDGVVRAVGQTETVTDAYPIENAKQAIDASGQCVLPGFIDCHTHSLFVGDRSDEFEAKLRGRSYQDILAEGGGILRTVRQVRQASNDELYERLIAHLDVMLEHGTTTAEIKSGYGLDTETELRMLSVIDRAREQHPIDIVPTFMGAHAVPEETDSEHYTEQVIEEQLPAVETQGVAEFCDVFCEKDVFTVDQSRRILEAGREHRLSPKIHADEFARLGASTLAAELSAVSADHLLQATESDIDALAGTETTPVFLPGTAFGLDGEYPDLEPYRERGMLPAIGSDFNPNCHAQSMGFAATVGCVGVGMTPAEAILAITARGASALDRNDGLGSLREGCPGDLIVLDAPAYRHVAYTYDVNLVETVVKAGTIVA